MSSLATWALIGVATLIVLLDLWAIISIFRSDTNVNAKALWSLLIVIFPLLGLAIWGVAGPRGVTQGPSSPEHSK
ncbi:PLD nuclease N-terminal domain-containing protein [Pseudomonas sp. LA21]|uniref:PLD nuclease N-terminal domain-containing protein n=1 Tax=unclassified Pseudomonas TaxID=196821 RepID=UPI001FB711AE|nr:PLD nuclease N-terminal domain-containing protein [Pseudomonas sp. LA21]MCJ1887112.1 PLD nuclease N-terminal domain-containing protein [Pseudomonas sp. LA21]